MAEFRDDVDPVWPEHLAEYRESDGWEHKLDFEIARVKWARSHGFKQFKMLPLMQSMIHQPADAEDEN